MDIGEKVIVEFYDDVWIATIADLWMNSEEVEFLVKWAELDADDLDYPDEATGLAMWVAPDMITPLEQKWITL